MTERLIKMDIDCIRNETVRCDKVSCECVPVAPATSPALVVPGEPAWPAACTISIEYSPANPNGGITITNPDVCAPSAALALSIAITALLRQPWLK